MVSLGGADNERVRSSLLVAACDNEYGMGWMDGNKWRHAISCFVTVDR
jgi:hypothetical protein